jgi:hypothetical protein
MDANLSNSDNLNELERRLADWKPAPDGLNVDAMLFAAGRASAGNGKARLAWPLVSGGLALLTVFLGVRLAAERAERLTLLQELHVRLADTSPVSPATSPTPKSETPPNAYLVLRREWEQRPGDRQVEFPVQDEASNDSTLPEANILRAWQPHGPREPL